MALMDTLYQAGFRGEGLRSAWAIAMRESGGRPQAFNGNTSTGDRSWGLFQINTLGSLQARVAQNGLKSERDLLDPATNARIAFKMSKGGTDWGAWAVGPNAYKGAPSNAVAKYEQWLAKFPGTKGLTDTKTRTTAAFEEGPAGVVAGPNPAQNLAMKQQAAQQMLAAAVQSVSGGSPAKLGGDMLSAMTMVRQQLRTAAITSAVSEQRAQATGGTTAATGITFNTGDKSIDKALAIANAQIGKPYVWGAESPSEGGFDCSGLIDYSFKQAGIPIPGRMTTKTALRMGVSVRGQKYRPGDWLILNDASHMVLYVGNGKVIAAPRKGEVVQYQDVSRFNNITDVRRVVPAGKVRA